MIGAFIGFGILIIFGIFTNNPALLYLAILIYGFGNIITGFMFYRNIDESIKFNSGSTDENETNDKGKTIGPITGGIFWDSVGPTAPFIISIFVELLLIPLYLLVVKILTPHVAESYEKSEEAL